MSSADRFMPGKSAISEAIGLASFRSANPASTAAVYLPS
jgi:hypothetical protein